MSAELKAKCVAVRELRGAPISREDAYWKVRSICRQLGLMDYNTVGWIWFDVIKTISC